MHGILQDLRFALRGMRKSAGFTAIALLTLAVGIGATTLMFAVVDAVLIRPLGYPHSEQIVYLTETNKNRQPGMSIAYANLQDWAAMNHVFSSIGAVRRQMVTLSGGGLAEQLNARQVSYQFFKTLGVSPVLGRAFTAEDDQPSADPVVIVSYGLWQRRFGSDKAVLGRSITLNQEPHTVIGVLPKEFSYYDSQPDAYIPIGLVKDPQFWQNRYSHSGTYAVARMKPGVTPEQARADMDSVAERLQQLYPATNRTNWVSVVPMREWMIGDIKKPLVILLAAVGLLLLIACANIANLLLAKGSGRNKEMAIRLAIGASRKRLIRQLLTESALLAFAGGVLGILLAFWGSSLLVGVAPNALPRVTEIGVDPYVLAFALGISLLTGILFGLAPAFHLPAVAAHSTLKAEERGSLSAGQQRLRSGLIVGEVALSLTLLMGAGLLIRSFQRVMQVDAGFNPRQMLTAVMVMPANKYKSGEQAESFMREILRSISAIPGVASVSAAMPMPMSGNEWDNDFILDNQRGESTQQLGNSEIAFLEPDYVQTMQIPLLAGRAFTEADTQQSMPVALVNQEFARRFLPEQNPIGRRIRFGEPQQRIGPETPDSHWQTIVGVIGSVRQYGLERRIVPTVYTPFAQAGTKAALRYLVIRTAVGNPLLLTEDLRKAVAQVDRDQAVTDVSTMDHRLTTRLAARQISMLLLGMFATLAMALGAVGIYGVISFWVVQRTREIGIRMALGAQRKEVLMLIMRRALLLLGSGLGLGLVGWMGAGRLLQSMLFDIGPNDARVLLPVVALLSAIALLASYIPARRAARVDPMVALRYE